MFETLTRFWNFKGAVGRRAGSYLDSVERQGLPIFISVNVMPYRKLPAVARYHVIVQPDGESDLRCVNGDHKSTDVESTTCGPLRIVLNPRGGSLVSPSFIAVWDKME